MNSKGIWKYIDKFITNINPNIAKNIPNIITSTRIFSSIILTMYLAVFGITAPITLGIWAGATALTDTLDGMIARRYNYISKFGAMLDVFADKILTWGIGFVLIAQGVIPPWTLLILGREVLYLYEGVDYKIKSGKSIRSLENDTREESNFKELIKDYRKGDIVVSSTVSKIRMWIQSLAVCLSLFLTNNPEIINAIFGFTVAFSAFDAYKSLELYKTKKDELTYTNKENIDEITIQEELEKELERINNYEYNDTNIKSFVRERKRYK